MPEWSLPPPILLAEGATRSAPGSARVLDHPPLADGCEIGLIALATDHAIENELRLFLPQGTGPGGINLYTTRVPAPDRFGPESLRATEAELARAASLLVPGSRLDVIAYGCTSATAAIGEDAVFAQIRNGRPGIACTSPMTAADAALRCFGARRIVLVTPYSDSVHAIVARDLERRGFSLVDQANFGIDEDSAITRVSPQRIADAVRDRHFPDAEAVFVACTSLRTATIVETLENELEMPVISSNRALAWHALALAIPSPLAAVGRGRPRREGEG